MCKLTTFFLVSTSLLFGQQNIKDYVQKNSILITTISPDSTNYNDLIPIGTAIGDARIVMLGEQDHGDAPTFLAKTRLIKYLHEQKGFNVLAFESDFFGLNNGWSKIKKDKSGLNSFLRNNILSLWAYCNACNELLYEYIPKTQNTDSPIMVTGFDNQMVYTHSREFIVHQLDSVLQTLNIPITQQLNYKSEILPTLRELITKFGYQLPFNDFFMSCRKILQTIKDQMDDKVADNDFWSRLIENLIAFNEEESNIKKHNARKVGDIRDKQMFLNLKWLLQEKYQNQKIIVWAANSHVSKYNIDKYDSMGNLMSKDTSINNKIYVIGFTSRLGIAGRLL